MSEGIPSPRLSYRAVLDGQTPSADMADAPGRDVTCSN
jgi:hypothetical protein